MQNKKANMVQYRIEMMQFRTDVIKINLMLHFNTAKNQGNDKLSHSRACNTQFNININTCTKCEGFISFSTVVKKKIIWNHDAAGQFI